MYSCNVFLVGSGPGDEGLITVRGLDLVKKADVILYDKLGARTFLKEAKPGCIMIDVGKASANHTFDQSVINQMLVQRALENDGKNIVVRLKGGDPFIFGRGGEEALYLKEHGINCEIIPGVSSSTSGPAFAGIPVTQRKMACTLAICTGHESAKVKSDINWDALAGMSTVVFLMGVANLPNICEKLIKAGKDPNTPAAAIRNAAMPTQFTITGTLQSLPEIAAEQKLEPPAIIVIGEVVNLREQIKWFENRPLFGKSIAVTRARQQAGSMVSKLRELGAEVFECPAVEIIQEPDEKAFQNFLADSESFKYVVFTSVNGVKGTFDQLYSRGLDARIFAGKTIAAIGPATAQELRSNGIRADLLPKKYTSEAMVPLFEKCKPGKTAMLRAEKGSEILPKELSKLGFEISDVTIYKTIKAPYELDEDLANRLREGTLDYVAFTSSSGAEGFKMLLDKAGIPASSVPAASIGPVTSETCKKIGYNLKLTAEESTVPGLVNAIAEGSNND